MVLLAGMVAGLLASVATGGSLRHLLHLRFRWPLVPIAAVGVRFVAVLTPLADTPLAAYLYVITLAVLLAWVIWHTAQLPGLWIVALGLLLNLAVVLANGARMPVDPALASAGPDALATRGVLGQYVLAGSGTRLAVLDDRIGAFGALSIGDLVMTLGMFVAAFQACRPRGWRPAWPFWR